MPNLRRSRRSRPNVEPGDVFRMMLLDGRTVLGRVIRSGSEIDLGPVPGAMLVYLYEPPLEIDHGDASLDPNRLIIPPIWTNRQGWLHGYWETVARRPLVPGDVRLEHCFRRAGFGLVDQRGLVTTAVSESCGPWALVAYPFIDDLVSDALGIPRAQLTPPETAELTRAKRPAHS